MPLRTIIYARVSTEDQLEKYGLPSQLRACREQRFGLPTLEPHEVKRMDTVLLVTEKRDLMAAEPKPWEDTETPLPKRISPYGSKTAEREFLLAYERLTASRDTPEKAPAQPPDGGGARQQQRS